MTYKADQPLGAEDIGYWDILDEHHCCVATVWPVYTDYDVGEKSPEATEQIARKFAAVEKLLEACKKALNAHHNGADLTDIMLDDIAPAIAAAEGKANDDIL